MISQMMLCGQAVIVGMKFGLISRIKQVPINFRACFTLVLVAFAINMILPQTAQAGLPAQAGFWFDFLNMKAEPVLASAEPVNDLLTEKFIAYENKQAELKVKNSLRTYSVVATAYSSDVAQTDDTPCITANGFNVCNHGKENIIAANFLPLGAKVRIPDIYGDKIFSVEDRMNQRYTYRIDLWKISRNDAITFGKRLVKLEVVEY